MKKTTEILNVGVVRADEIELCDSSIDLYIPMESSSEKVEVEYEKFKGWVVRDAKKHFPNYDFSKCTLFTETCLHVHTGGAWDNYKMYFSVGFTMWYEDENGKEIYADCSDPFDIELSEEDTATVKKMALEKLMERFKES